MASASMALSSAFARTLNLSTSSFTGSKLSGSPISVPSVARPQQTPQIVAKQLQGKVTQNVCDKTASVAVTRIYEHPRYKKRLRMVKKYPAHDPENLCQVGDWVTIKLCRPVSKSKKFAVVQVNGKKTMAEEILQQELLDRRGKKALPSFKEHVAEFGSPLVAAAQ